MNNRSVSTATLGYMAYALSFWLIGVVVAGWSNASSASLWTLALPLVILLLVVGILAVVQGRTLDSIAFLAGAALLWSTHAFVSLAMVPHGLASSGFAGWFWIVWAAFYGWVFVAALNAGRTRMVFLLGVALTYLAFAIADWGQVHVIEVIGGYLSLATALIAAAISASEINGHGRAGHLKQESQSPGAAPG